MHTSGETDAIIIDVTPPQYIIDFVANNVTKYLLQNGSGIRGRSRKYMYKARKSGSQSMAATFFVIVLFFVFKQPALQIKERLG